MKFLLSLCVILSSVYCNAQSSYNTVKHYANDSDNTPLKDRRNSYVLADDVLLRSGPGSEFKVVESLSIGSVVKLLAQDTSTLSLNGVNSYWYSAALENGTRGYVWGGLVAQNQFGSSQPGGVKFFLGLEKLVKEEVTDESGNTYDDVVFYTQIRAVENGKEIAKFSVKNNYQTFDLSAVESYGYGTTNLGPSGLSNVNDIIRLHVPCRGGCGCTTGDVYVVWDGAKFHYLTETWGTADAQYSEGDGIIFPNAINGEPGYIIRSVNRVLWDDYVGSKEDERVDQREEFLEYYIWNGKSLTSTGRKTESIIKDIEDY